jgi:hypothetical protein
MKTREQDSQLKKSVIERSETDFDTAVYSPQIITDLPHADLDESDHNLSDADDEIDHEIQRLVDDDNPKDQFSEACWFPDHLDNDELQLKSAH